MKRSYHRWVVLTGPWVFLLLGLARVLAQPNKAPLAPGAATVLGFQGAVEVQRAENARWDPAYTNQVLDAGNRLRTDKNSLAMLRFSDLETVRVGPRSLIRIEGKTERKRSVEFLKGVLYFFHRDKPDEFEVRTPQMAAIIRGTEFTLEVADDGTTTLSLLDGQVAVSNPLGQLDLTSGEQAIAEPGKPPRRTAIIEAVNLVQWCLYYPAVLNADELNLSPAEQQALAQSLSAYRSGDLLAALAAYPQGRQPASEQERVYNAALLLSVGNVSEAEAQLNLLLDPNRPETPVKQLAAALQKLIAAVKYPEALGPDLTGQRPGLGFSTSLLAESYYLQSRLKLEDALAAARQALRIAPQFAFAWARVAELEFGFGRIPAASEALQKSLQLAPRNAEALALRGFLLAARNKTIEAVAAFNQAIALDPALGPAWLGRGLCRIREGQAQAGREDLQVAATLEPNRAVFRSYLGKAFSQAGDNRRARRELELARKLDPRDPTGALGFANAVKDLRQKTTAGGILYVFTLPR